MDLELSNNYHLALMLICSMGFNKVSKLNDSYVFTATPSRMNLNANETTTYTLEQPTQQQRISGMLARRRAYRGLPYETPYDYVNSGALTPPNYFNPSTPSSIQQQRSISVQSEHKTQLVPFSLTFPMKEYASLATIKSSLKLFFERIIALANDDTKDKTNYNIDNLDRLNSMAMVFLHTNKRYKDTDNLCHDDLNNALFSGVRYCGIDYLGAIRWLNASDNAELALDIKNNTQELTSSAELTKLANNEDYKAFTEKVLMELYEHEPPELTAELNAALPEALTAREWIAGQLSDLRTGAIEIAGNISKGASKAWSKIKGFFGRK